jgi:crossover junction endodeoxyribonuclease RusA
VTAYEIEIPLARTRKDQREPGPPLHANQRLHYMARSKLVRLVRQATHLRAVQAKIPAARHITVGLHYAPGSGGREFDPANLWPTQKAAVDGLRDAKIVRDDTAKWVTEQTPVIHPGPGDRRLWLTVEVHT